MTGRSTGRICRAALVFATCILAAPSAAEQKFRHGQMVVLDQRGPVNQPLPLGISLTGNSGTETVVLEGLAEGTQLSVGVSLSSNRWSLPAKAVDKAFVGAPHDFSGTMEVTAKLYSASNEPLQSDVVRLEWTRGGDGIASENPIRGVDAASGVNSADAGGLLPAPQASPPFTSASSPIVETNSGQADSPASPVSVPEDAKSSQPNAPAALDRARLAENLDAPAEKRLPPKATSQGADSLASRASMYTKAPAPVLFSWTGFYIGLNVGGKWAHIEGHVGADTLDSIGLAGTNGSTVIGGGQIGYTWQAPGIPWVFGIEADVDGQDWSATRTFGVRSVFFLPGDTFTVESHWQASVRGRIGYAWDRTLLYATGGVAFTQVKAGTLLVPAPGLMQGSSTSDDQTVAGGTVGGGIEYAFTNNVSVGAEGRWTFYGGNDLSGGARAHSLVTQHIKLDSAEARGTLNFRF